MTAKVNDQKSPGASVSIWMVARSFPKPASNSTSNVNLPPRASRTGSAEEDDPKALESKMLNEATFEEPAESLVIRPALRRPTRPLPSRKL